MKPPTTPREMIAHLQHELSVANNWIEHHQNHVDDLIKENAALCADKERLDWLDHNAIPWTWMSPEKIDGLGPIVVTWKSNRTLRAAIDAARKEGQP